MLGLRLMMAVGKSVLRTAVASLAPQIKDVARITIEAIPDIAIGSSVQAKAKAFDRTGAEIPHREMTWTTKPRGAATVDTNGTIHGVATGSTTITAAADATSATVVVKVI